MESMCRVPLRDRLAHAAPEEVAMRRILVALGLATTLTSAVSALAASAEFHYANASVTSAGALAVSFKETGLGDASVTTAQIQINADASAVYQCWNNGGQHPKAGNKTTVNGPLAASGDFPIRNGEVTGTQTAGPLGPGSFSCPSGQSLFLMSVSYTNISVADLTFGDGPVPASPASISETGLFIPA
jgi:hypothetical protein